MNELAMKHEILNMHARLCSAAADPTRIRIIYLLRDSSKNFGEIANELGISHSSASRHLRILYDQSIVKTEKIGHFVEYHMNAPEIIQALDIFLAVLHDQMKSRAQIIRTEKKG